MALRHRVPDFQPSLDRPADMNKVLPRFPKTPTIEFRRGADLGQVVEAIASNKILAVEAAVGAGKSTVLPYQVAKQTGLLVVQVFPNQYLAADISAYCRSKGEDSVFIAEPDEDFPEIGVACIAANVLVARWLAIGQASLPKCIVFHDESHEPDVYTFVVKNIASSLKNLRCYVTATATAQGGGFRRMETDGNVLDRLVSDELIRSTWDVYGDAPWSVETLDGHMLVFEDSKTRAEDLAQQYRLAGIVVYRLHARMALDEFQEAMQIIRDPASPIVVLIADHSFRSGLTVPVVRIVDTARVNFVAVQDGRPVRQSRHVYEAESYQARGRGGRLNGLSTQYFRPDVELKPYVSELEAADVDAAALILRLLGYALPHTLAKSSTMVGDVPRMLVSALKGFMPLACLQSSQKLPIDEFFSPSGRRSPYLKQGFEFNNKPADVTNQQMSADVAMSRGVGNIRKVEVPVPDIVSAWHDQQAKADIELEESRGRPSYDFMDRQVEVPAPLRAQQRVERDEEHYDHRERMERVADTIRSFTMHKDKVDTMEIGIHYYATGLISSSSFSAAFPDGHESVLRWLSKDMGESAHLGLSDRDRCVAVNALLLRYNAKTCEMRVLSHAIPEAKVRGAGKDLSALRVWATKMSEAILGIVAELRVLTRYIIRLVRNFCGLEEMPPMMDSERYGRDKVMRELDALPNAEVGPPDDFMRELRSKWKELPDGYARTVSSGSDSGLGLYDVQMPTVGKGMRAVHGSSELSVRGGGHTPVEYSIRKDRNRKLSLVRRSA